MCTRLCLALFKCGDDINYPHVIVLPAFFWIALLTLGQSYDCLVSGIWSRTCEGHHTSRPQGRGVGCPCFSSLLIVGLVITKLYRILCYFVSRYIESISMAWCRTVVAPVHKQWRCCGLALSHRYRYPAYWTSLNVHGFCPAFFHYYDYVIGCPWMWPDYPYSSGVHRWHWGRSHSCPGVGDVNLGSTTSLISLSEHSIAKPA